MRRLKRLRIRIVSEFEESRKEEEGYQEVVVKHEVISTTDDYFTLKLMCYQAAGQRRGVGLLLYD